MPNLFSSFSYSLNCFSWRSIASRRYNLGAESVRYYSDVGVDRRRELPGGACRRWAAASAPRISCSPSGRMPGRELLRAPRAAVTRIARPGREPFQAKDFRHDRIAHDEDDRE